MSITTIEYIIKCIYCGIETGRLQLPKWKWEGITLTNAVLGIEDSRCSACELEHGKLSD